MRQTIAQAPSSRANSSSQGVTLIECLVAILVIGLTASLITPPIFIAVATRAQNRRAEQALQIAQGEIDRIRVMVARGEHTVARLPKAIPAGTALNAYTPPTGFFGANLVKTPVASAACPTGASITRYSNQVVDPDKALKVDVDGDCTPDFFMQVFRTPGDISADQRQRTADATLRKPSDFQLGVRVYSMLADGNSAGNAWSNLQRQPASLGLTNGEGGQRRQPLAVIYSPFSWSDQSTALCDYYQDSNSSALTGSCPARTP